MKKTIEKYYCDICKEEVEKQHLIFNVRLPMVCSTEQEEGRSVNTRIIFENIDICKNCLEKVTVVEYGFRKVKGFK